jgi:hypothetical protein
MDPPILRNFLGAAAAVTVSLSAFSADRVPIRDDLKATIVLHGFTCDDITSRKRSGDSDYVVACKDGNRYHVFVDSRGRVTVEKQ